jgi:methylamine methyltransferase corrinoid protein reductive activase
MLKREETALAIDFGTNAEMALFHKGSVVTGSAAAGPALEGRQITCGRLAMPGVIADLGPAHTGAMGDAHQLILLNEEMLPFSAALVDLRKKGVIDGKDAPQPLGITGTGTVAIIEQAIRSGLVSLPHITTADHLLHLGDEIFLTEEDLVEAGKAFGAVRAGYSTLCHEAGITPQDVSVVYMSGASGTYVDALKSQQLGMIPPAVKTVYQVGNTSLSMARDLVTDSKKLALMSELAERFRKTHCMFAASPTFKKIFILEFSHWTEGMPMDRYRALLKRYGLPDLLPVQGKPRVVRTVQRDINDLGREGMVTITDIGSAAELCVSPG